MQVNLRRRLVAAVGLTAAAAMAQTPPAPAVNPPVDNPSFKIGATIFSDWSYVDSPTSADADGKVIHPSSFNVSRAYINLTGNLNHRIAFRITPDIARESGSGSSLSGSQTFRLKYAFGQFNLDDWTTKGSWVRFGLQQTPLVDFLEGVYRYRFQGPVFVDREGFLSSSDNGLSARWTIPADHGDIQGGFFNGETYSKAETNNEKAFQLRATVRPLPAAGAWSGLRLTGFVDHDNYLQDAKRQRYVGNVTYEHRLFNAGFEYLQAKDRASVTKPTLDSSGYSVWVTPRFGASGWEMLLRHDELKPNNDLDQKRKRDIVGVAYWVPKLNKVTSALMVDYDSLRQDGFSPSRPDDRRYGLKMLINF